jgi:hypothetical protein
VPTGSSAADSARQQAHQILDHPPFTTTTGSGPHPLAGVLHAVGRGLQDVFGPVYRWVVHHVFGAIGSGLHGIFGAWTPVAAIVLVVAAGVLLALVLVRRRTRIAARAQPAGATGSSVDPSTLEEEAERLAAAGDYAGSVRLRFEAGLLRLEGDGLIAQQRTSTDAELSARIGSPAFSRLATRHEEIAYAGLPASRDDVEQARVDWPHVPREARARRDMEDAPS